MTKNKTFLIKRCIAYTLLAVTFLLLSFNSFSNSQQIFAYYLSVPCAGSISQPGSITGSTTVCPNATGVAYSIKLVPGATGYNWSVPLGATLVTGQGSTAITVNFGATGGNVCVSAENACGTSGQRCLAVTVGNFTAGTISSNQTICNGATPAALTFTTMPTGGTGSYSYQWYNGSGIITGVTNFTYSQGALTATTTITTESFDAVAFPPAGWLAKPIVDTYNWERTTTGIYMTESPHSGAGEAWYDDYDAGAGDEAILVSPSFTEAGNISGASVNFWMYRDTNYCTEAEGIYPDSLYVWYSTNTSQPTTISGASLLGKVPRCGTDTGWYQHSYTIPGTVTGSTVWLIFDAHSANGEEMYIDDVSWTAIGSPPLPYYCCVTSGTCGTVTTNTVSITVSKTPIPTSVMTIGSPNPICTGNSLTLTANGGVGATNWSWSGPNNYTSITQSPSLSITGTVQGGVYSVTATNACGSATASTGFITVNTPPTSVMASASPNPICTGNSLTLTETDIGGTSWQWSGPNGYKTFFHNPVLSITGTVQSGIYTITATNDCGSIIESTNYVTANIAPSYVTALPNPDIICTGNSLTFTGAGTNVTTWSWSGPNAYTSALQSPTLSITGTVQAGVYTLTATNIDGCWLSANTDFVRVNTGASSPPIAGTITPSQNQILWTWSDAGSPNFMCGTSTLYGSATDNGTSPAYYQMGLTCNTAYTLYVWAYNGCGNSSYITLTQSTSVCGCSSSGIINTIAGTGVNGYNGDGIAAVSAELYYPQGAALDASGNVFIADAYNNRVRKITVSNGLISTVAGNGSSGYYGDGATATNAKLNRPNAVFIDATGNLYITDGGNSRIRKVILSTGIITTIAGNGGCCYNGDGIPATSAEFYSPNRVAVDGSGNVYIADVWNGRIRKVMTNGIISTIAGGGGGGYAEGIPAVNSVLDLPTGVFVDASGNVYIAEYGNNRVRKITAGIINTIAGDGPLNYMSPCYGYNGDGIPATSTNLCNPYGVVTDASGNVYIAESGANRIRKITASSGIISTIAGNGGVGYNGDGIPATDSYLDGPYDVRVDGSGTVYITDEGDYRVRKVCQ